MGGGYDSAPFLDASGRPGALALESLRLEAVGRPWRTLRAEALLSADARDLPSAGSQSYKDVELRLGARQRLLDSLSLLAGVQGGYGAWPAMGALNAWRYEGRGGLAWSPLEDLELAAEGLYGGERQNGYDLSHQDKGFRAELKAQHDAWTLRAAWSSRWQAYFDRFNPLSITNYKTTVFREDQVDEGEAGLSYDQDRWSMGAGWSWRQRRSNAAGLDFGPGQNAVNDPSFLDNTLIKDMESVRQQGPWARLSWRPLQRLGLDWRGSLSQADYAGRLAKDSQDHFLAGKPPRWDQAYESQLDATWDLDHWGLSLDLRWIHQDSGSNDTFFAYSRDESWAGLKMAF